MADRGDVGISDTRTQHTDCVYWLLQSTHSTEFSQKLYFKKGLILIGRCRIVRMICVGSLNYASEEEEEEEEER